ncbi:MAG: hypothetical protein ACOVMM_08725 [Chitinophagaceae bacterium]
MTHLNNINEYNIQKPKRTLAENLQMARNIVMAIAFLVMGLLMIFPKKLGVDFLMMYSELQRYLFGGICVLYGGFRIFRAFVKTDY